MPWTEKKQDKHDQTVDTDKQQAANKNVGRHAGRTVVKN